ncbi:Multidrug resistance-associated protein 1 [Hypsibius exemplaris]|uniref:ABC-type glutathione-S-conjugate transporter n=1 Tax=Hypsibius exemplaris TaxID=2072580 RepID=A0A1W0WT57_HYPEX|nr:Multidrug resistance-associated protein 1 [Hypsibius exemplaris]
MSSYLCRGPYWDDKVTWHTSDPDFTDCFQKTVLVWLPAAFLCLCAPIEICLAFRHGTTNYVPNRLLKQLFRLKSILTAFLAAITCAEVAYFAKYVNESVNGLNPHAPNLPVRFANLSSAVVRLLTYGMHIAFLYLDRRRGRRSSVILFFFWLILVITEGINFRTNIKFAINGNLSEASPLRLSRFMVHLIQYPLLLLQLILSALSPGDEGDVEKSLSPEKRSSFLNQALFWWFNSLLYRGYKTTLRPDDVWDLNPNEKAKNVAAAFLERLAAKKQDLQLGRTLLQTFWPELLYSAALRFSYNIMLFLIPEILRLLINFAKDRSAELWKGYMFAALLLIASIMQSIFVGHCVHQCNRLGLKLRTALMSAVYRKVIRVAQFADGTSSIGQPTNLITIDSQRIMDLTQYINQIWEVPLQIVVGTILLYRVLGVSSLAGLGVMIVSVPILGMVAVRIKKLQMTQMASKDQRIRLTGEFFRAIKNLKLYAWEEVYAKQILQHRKDEIRNLKQSAYLQANITAYSIISPFIVGLAVFATYVLSDSSNILDSTKAFVAMAIFNILKNSITLLPPTIGIVVQAMVCEGRLSHALKSPEADTYVDKSSTAHRTEPAVKITNADFSWAKQSMICLHNIQFRAQQGQLIGIIGQAGSGKTALCRALLGLMHRRSGAIATTARIAYMPQQAWLQSQTLKKNILFGRPMQETRYQATITGCALTEDLQRLQSGDETELGDQGSNLSGGQKQRICLARTVYGDEDVFVLDDPFSALDPKVSEQVFQTVVGPAGFLQGKTRIVVTSGYRFLPYFDHLIVMDDGRITRSGSFEELLAQGDNFSTFLQTRLMKEVRREVNANPVVFEPPNSELSLNVPVLTLQVPYRDEDTLSHKSDSSARGLIVRDRSTGTLDTTAVKPDVKTLTAETKSANAEVAAGKSTNWKSCLSIVGPATVKIIFLIVFTNTMSTVFSVGSSIWLSKWTQENQTTITGEQDTAMRDYRLGYYGLFGVGQGIFLFVSMLMLSFGLTRASRILHNKMMRQLVRAPLYFFDMTPLGRITNRFSADIDAIDVTVPLSLRQCISSVFNILATFSVLIYSYPVFTAFMVPIAVVYSLLQYFYASTSRQLKQLESASRSKILSHYQETISGAGLIAVFGERQRFAEEFDGFLDAYNRMAYSSLTAQRWLSLRLELIGNVVAFIAAMLAVYGRDAWGIDPGTVGLSITYAVQVTQVLSRFVQRMTDLQMTFVAIERVVEYTKCPQEAKWVLDDSRPHREWPQQGAVTFYDYKTRYRPDLDLALSGISCSIAPGEKIGIVGRTGAGKSSLSLGLFRIVEAVGGGIAIDGLDVSTIGLHDLRSRITIIPQDPFMLSGSLRSNLDPTTAMSDEDIWKALEIAHLKRYISQLPEGLQYKMTEGGTNFSVGQRQMFCLARAILRRPKLLLMDEATASLDAQTDELLQEAISNAFSDCTVITIAHRLQSILNSDRIMVLDKGKIIEMDRPATLLSDVHSSFYSLANHGH